MSIAFSLLKVKKKIDPRRYLGCIWIPGGIKLPPAVPGDSPVVPGVSPAVPV